MAASTTPAEAEWTAADLLEHFGPILLRRIHHNPPPGLATEQDVIDIHDLAIEILSPHNTKREMDRKLAEYFDSGVNLVWSVDPRSRTVAVYASPNESRRLGEGQSLEGGGILPGFSVSLTDLFRKLEPPT